MRKVNDIIAPFRVALAGLVFTFRTQKHMRFHLYVVVVVLLLGVVAQLGFREILVLLFTISFVLVAEMFNSAIEATVDLVSPNYHPLAKFAKDISAGDVLITTIIALVVGALLILGEQHWEQIKINLTSEGFGIPVYAKLTLGMLAVFFIVVIGKGLGKRGQVLQGGLVAAMPPTGSSLRSRRYSSRKAPSPLPWRSCLPRLSPKAVGRPRSTPSLSSRLAPELAPPWHCWSSDSSPDEAAPPI